MASSSHSREARSMDNMANYQFDEEEYEADDMDQDDGEEFFVESILMNKNEKKKGELFLIKWRGFGVDACTWEPISNLEDVLDMVEEFKQNTLPKLKGVKTKQNGMPVFDWKRAKITGTQKSPVDKKSTEFLIKWEGYPLETWEPKKSVPSDLLRAFEKSPAKTVATPSKKRKRTEDDDDVAEDNDDRPVVPAKKTRSAKRSKTGAHKSSTPPTTSTPATPSKNSVPINIDEEASDASTSNTNKEVQKPQEEKQTTPPSPTEIPFIMPAASQGTVRYNEKQPARVDGTKRLDKVLHARVVWLSTITHTFVPMSEIRVSHPQELLDYLISRMILAQDFKRDDANTNTTPTTATTTQTEVPESAAAAQTTPPTTSTDTNEAPTTVEQPVEQQQEKQQDTPSDVNTEKAVEQETRSSSPDL